MSSLTTLTLANTALLHISSMNADEVLRIVCIVQLLIIWGLLHKISNT